MSLRNRRAMKRDANEPEIVSALRKAGAVVFPIDSPADLLIYWRGQFIVAEVKDSAKPPSARKLTCSQLVSHAMLPPGAIPILLSVDDALAMLRGIA
jgi:hypothetical protein